MQETYDQMMMRHAADEREKNVRWDIWFRSQGIDPGEGKN